MRGGTLSQVSVKYLVITQKNIKLLSLITSVRNIVETRDLRHFVRKKINNPFPPQTL